MLAVALVLLKMQVQAQVASISLSFPCWYEMSRQIFRASVLTVATPADLCLSSPTKMSLSVLNSLLLCSASGKPFVIGLF